MSDNPAALNPIVGVGEIVTPGVESGTMYPLPFEDGSDLLAAQGTD
jgi:hypothetical protein